MILSKEEIDLIIDKLVDSIKAEIDGALKKVILFGSYARGDYKDYSDLDVMFLVDSIDLNKMYEHICKETNDLGLEYLVMVSCVFQDISWFYHVIDYNSFYKNVEKEGVVYYDATSANYIGPS